jgi:hypothetical protein
MGSLGRRLREVFPRKRLSLIALTGFADANIREHCVTGDLMHFLSSLEKSLESQDVVEIR